MTGPHTPHVALGRISTICRCVAALGVYALLWPAVWTADMAYEILTLIGVRGRHKLIVAAAFASSS